MGRCDCKLARTLLCHNVTRCWTNCKHIIINSRYILLLFLSQWVCAHPYSIALPQRSDVSSVYNSVLALCSIVSPWSLPICLWTQLPLAKNMIHELYLCLMMPNLECTCTIISIEDISVLFRTSLIFTRG